MSAVISDGLYVLLHWIAQRRRETNEYIRQYADNMMKSLAVIHRRSHMVFQPFDLVSLVESRTGRWRSTQTLLYGVPATTRRGGWFQAPDHEYMAWVYNQWITDLLAETPQRPYYFPGL